MFFDNTKEKNPHKKKINLYLLVTEKIPIGEISRLRYWSFCSNNSYHYLYPSLPALQMHRKITEFHCYRVQVSVEEYDKFSFFEEGDKRYCLARRGFDPEEIQKLVSVKNTHITDYNNPFYTPNEAISDSKFISSLF